MVFKECKVQKIASFLLRFQEAVQDCKELWTLGFVLYGNALYL